MKSRLLIKNPVIKNVLSAIAVAFFGFILLTFTFIFDALFQSLVDWIVKLFTSVDFNMAWPWFPPVKHALFVVIIGLISWIVFKSKLKVLYKAIYLTVPVATVLVTVGMFLYRWPILSYSIGSLLCIGTLYYFYRTKQHWIYYYTVILIGLTLAIFTMSGGEI
jgi:hypothetical protein